MPQLIEKVKFQREIESIGNVCVGCNKRPIAGPLCEAKGHARDVLMPVP
jgi:hypothetical protein